MIYIHWRAMSSAIYVVRQEKGISLVPPCWTETIGQREKQKKRRVMSITWMALLLNEID